MKLIFLGCLSNSRYKDTCANAIKIIQHIDNQFETVQDVPCCGSLSYQITDIERMRDHVNYVNDWLQTQDVTELVTICAGCYNYFTKYYPKILGEKFKVKIQHILQFLAKNLEKLDLKNPNKKYGVSYHDACHLRNAHIPIIKEPRLIIESIEGIEFREMEINREFSICCGAGGGVYSIFKENSDFNANAIFKQMKKSKLLLTACPFCYTAFKRVRDEQNLRRSVMKFEDFIAKLIFEKGEGII